MKVQFDGKMYEFKGSKFVVETMTDRLVVNGKTIAVSSPNPTIE